MGEIVSAEGFEAEPLCVHYLVEMPKGIHRSEIPFLSSKVGLNKNCEEMVFNLSIGWRNDSSASSLYGITHNSFVTDERVAHFSQDFFFQLVYSMDSVHQEDTC